MFDTSSSLLLIFIVYLSSSDIKNALNQFIFVATIFLWIRLTIPSLWTNIYENLLDISMPMSNSTNEKYPLGRRILHFSIWSIFYMVMAVSVANIFLHNILDLCRRKWNGLTVKEPRDAQLLSEWHWADLLQYLVDASFSLLSGYYLMFTEKTRKSIVEKMSLPVEKDSSRHCSHSPSRATCEKAKVFFCLNDLLSQGEKKERTSSNSMSTSTELMSSQSIPALNNDHLVRFR